MKKNVSVALAIGFALAFFLFYSSDSVAVEKEKSAVPYNGITYFEMSREPISAEGSAAGGAGPIKETFNGITVFDRVTLAAPAKAADSGEPGTPYNGITVFK